MDRGTPKNWGAVVLCSVLSLVVGGTLVYFTRQPSPGAPIIVATPTVVDPPETSSAPIRVHVTGAVRNPDVYHLPAGCIVRDAVEAAGGATSDADLERINLAVELEDQQQVYVPRQGEGGQPSPVSGSGDGEGRVNINTATAEELDALPRIGPATAQRIIDHRETHGPFPSIEAIQDVSGIGPATFEGLKDLITVGP